MEEDKNTQKWVYPSIELLDEPVFSNEQPQDTKKNAEIIVDTLKSFDIITEIDKEKINIGPAYTRYQLDLKSATDISKIKSLENNLAMAVASVSGSVRIEAPIPRKNTLGIEIPNEKRQKVYFKTVASIFDDLRNKPSMQIPIGLDAESKIFTQDIKLLPHLIITGTTGSGKSQLLHNIILSLLFTKTPDEVKMILIDPKRVELLAYNGIPHLLRPVIRDMDEGVNILSWAVEEMQNRFAILEKARVRTTNDYNKKIGKFELPNIVLIFDEYGDLIVRDPAEFEGNIIRIAQLGKLVGMHLILSASRPSVETITGLIKANIPARVGFQVFNKIDSILIVDQEGAEKLLGQGDMLFVPHNSPTPVRLQSPYVSFQESMRVVDFIKKINQLSIPNHFSNSIA